MAGAHCKGWNERSVGDIYIGGLMRTYTGEIPGRMLKNGYFIRLVIDLQREYNILRVGTSGYFTDLNGDGVIEPWRICEEVCPCFDVKKEF